MTSMNEYQMRARETAIYTNKVYGAAGAIQYATLGLVGEAGEIANKVKKIVRDHNGNLTPEVREALIEELGDVLWYVANLALELHVDLGNVADRNILKLSGRSERGTLGGSGDVR